MFVVFLGIGMILASATPIWLLDEAEEEEEDDDDEDEDDEVDEDDEDNEMSWWVVKWGTDGDTNDWLYDKLFVFRLNEGMDEELRLEALMNLYAAVLGT